MTMDYLLPLRVPVGTDVSELAQYARRLAEHLDVVVVDGSEPTVFAANHHAFAGVLHVPPAPELRCLNGKVAGVRTGFGLCRSDLVIVADDDVRYERNQLDVMARLLTEADVVAPQNFFRPLPWHARWDTARSLVNRALWGGDFPGTLGLRLTAELRDRGYDGDVLFENLELMRTVQAAGGRIVFARDLFVRRLPPSARHFVGQRVRQAYDSQGQPVRCLVELLALPALALAARRPRMLTAVTVALLTVAERGRRRDDGRAVFPAGALAFVPAWVIERAVCAWLAFGLRIAGRGVGYAGRRMVRAAHSVRSLEHARRAKPDGWSGNWGISGVRIVAYRSRRSPIPEEPACPPMRSSC